MPAALPPLPGVDVATAPSPEEPGYAEWLDATAFSPEGVDRTLIWSHLHLTPDERLAVLERVVNDVLELRGGRWPAVR